MPRACALPRGLFFLACAAISSVSPEGRASAPSEEPTAVAAELRRSTQSLLDAIAPGDVAVWDRLLDEKAIQVDENDVVRNKMELLAALKPLSPGLVGHLTIDDFRVVENGGTAVVTHEDDEYLDYHGQIIRSRFRMTDTWIHSRDGWKKLASQVLAVLQHPPVRKLDAKVLCGYSGTYELTAEINGTMRCENGELVFERPARPARHFRSELLDVFFEPGEPRTRRIFARDQQGRITGFVDRREGRDIVWRRTGTSRPAGLPTPSTWPPQLEMRVPFEPTAFPNAGRTYLTYELYLTTLAANPVTLHRVEVLDADKSAVTPIAAFDAERLDALLQPVGTQMSADGSGDRRQLAAGATVVMFLWIALEPGTRVPNTLRHRVLTADSAAEGAVIGTHHTELQVLGSPVTGAHWLASDGPSNDQDNHHRRIIFVF
jgi:hypothetical protein